MYVQKLVPVVGLLAANVAADFIIMEDVPVPTAVPTGGLDEYISSITNVITSKLPEVVKSLGIDYVSKGLEYQTDLESFVKTATFSVPAGVTNIDELVTFTETPVWFTALPSNVQSFNEENQSIFKSIYAEAVGVSVTPGPAASSGPTPTTGASQSTQSTQGTQASGTPTGTAAEVSGTGSAGLVAGMGAGYLAVAAAAAFL